MTTFGMSLHCQVMDHDRWHVPALSGEGSPQVMDDDLWDVLAYSGDGSRPLGCPCIFRRWLTTVRMSLQCQVMDHDRWHVPAL